MRAPLSQLNIVIAAAGVDHQLMSLRPELRMVKAALLYADTVTLVTPKIALRRMFARMDRPDDEYRRRVDETGITRKPGWAQAFTIVRGAQLHERELTPEERRTITPFLDDFAELARLRREAAERALASPEQDELKRAVSSGAVILRSLEDDASDPVRHADAVAEEFEDILNDSLDASSGMYPLFDEVAWLSVGPVVRRSGLTPRELAPANEAALATRFIVDQVEAYADARIDELLDVRDRLTDPLIRFRAAMAKASHEIESTGFDAAFERETRALFRREVEPALQELREGVVDLGLRATLRRAAEPAAQWLAIGAGTAAAVTQFREAAVSAASGFATAVGATLQSELRHERQLRQRQKANSYFFLWRADHLVRKAVGHGEAQAG